MLGALARHLPESVCEATNLCNKVASLNYHCVSLYQACRITAPLSGQQWQKGEMSA